VKIPKQINVKTALIFVAIGILITSLVFYGFAATPSSTFYISGGVYPGAPSYTVWREGSNYFAKDSNGLIAYSGTNASQIIQNIIDANTYTSIDILFKFGEYTFTKTMTTTHTGLKLRGEAGGVDVKLVYSGSGTAFVHNSGRDLIVQDLRCDGGEPFFNFTNGVGSGRLFLFERVFFWTSTKIAIITGESNPFFWIKHCHFRCTSYAIELEKDSDALIEYNYFFGTASMTKQIYLRPGTVTTKIDSNIFVGTNDTKPEIVIEVGEGLPTGNIAIVNNKFGGEQLQAPNERILFTYSGSGTATFRECWIDYNYVNCRSDAQACPNFINATSDIIFARVSISFNIFPATSGTGYVLKYDGNANSKENLATGNIVQDLYNFIGFNCTGNHGFTIVDNIGF